MMQLRLDEISRNVAEGAHAVLLLDRAGWHITGKLDVPDNITPIFLPSRAPELSSPYEAKSLISPSTDRRRHRSLPSSAAGVLQRNPQIAAFTTAWRTQQKSPFDGQIGEESGAGCRERRCFLGTPCGRARSAQAARPVRANLRRSASQSQAASLRKSARSSRRGI
jgi:hypothetical protein